MNKPKFRFRYGVLTWVLLSLVAVVLVFGTVKNFYDFLVTYEVSSSRAIFCAVISALCLILLAITVSVAISGKYIVKDGTLTMKLGVFATKTDISLITQISHFKKQDKLVIYLKSGKYSVIVINPAEYSDFINAIKAENPNIPFIIESAEN